MVTLAPCLFEQWAAREGYDVAPPYTLALCANTPTYGEDGDGIHLGDGGIEGEAFGDGSSQNDGAI